MFLSAVLTSIQSDQYLENRDGCSFPNAMGFDLKTSVFQHQTLQGKGFCFTRSYQPWDFIYRKNNEKETFSLVPRDVQMSPGGQSGTLTWSNLVLA